MKFCLKFIVFPLSLISILSACSGNSEPAEQELITRRELLADSVQVINRKISVLSDQVYRTVNDKRNRSRFRNSLAGVEDVGDLLSEVKKETRDLLDNLNRITDQLCRIASCDSATGRVRNTPGTEENNRFFFVEGPGRDEPAGWLVNNWLENYRDQLEELMRNNGEHALFPKKINRSTQSEVDWPEETFRDKSLLHSLTKLEEIKLKVVRQGYHFILHYAQKLDELLPPAPPDSLYLEVDEGNGWVREGEVFECTVRVMPDDFEGTVGFGGDGEIDVLDGGRAALYSIETKSPRNRLLIEQPYLVRARVALNNGKTIDLEHKGVIIVEGYD